MDRFELATHPKDWEMTPIGDCCEQITISCDPAESNGKPYFGLEHLASGFLAFVGVGNPQDVRSTKSVFQAGDILYGKLRPYLRKAARANTHGICSTDIIVLRTNGTMLAEFAIYLVHTDQFVNRAKATTSGVDHPRTTWNKLKPFVVPCPPLTEQRKIAAVLSAVQRAIEQQERLMALTTELKKALMHKLFTEGTRRESLKETEIGAMPQSWGVFPLGDALEIAQYGLSLKGAKTGDYPILRMTNQVEGRIVPNDLQWVQLEAEHFGRFSLCRGDVLFNRTNSFELVGRTAIFDLEGEYTFASFLIRLRFKTEIINPFFLNHYFNCDETQRRLKSIVTRAVSQSNITATRLKGFAVPFPTDQEQVEIIDRIDVIDAKLANLRQRENVLQDLFRTLLHQLMTAHIRVHHVDLSELGVEAEAAARVEVA